MTFTYEKFDATSNFRRRPRQHLIRLQLDKSHQAIDESIAPWCRRYFGIGWGVLESVDRMRDATRAYRYRRATTLQV
jgi:hypothetical protein